MLKLNKFVSKESIRSDSESTKFNKIEYGF